MALRLRGSSFSITYGSGVTSVTLFVQQQKTKTTQTTTPSVADGLELSSLCTQGTEEGAVVKALRAEISRLLREPDHADAIGGNAVLLPVQCQGFFAEGRLIHVLRECPKEIVAEFQVLGRDATM